MQTLLGRLITRIAAGAAVVVILLAIAVGAFRLLMMQLPSYQGEIQAWAAEALGLTVNFSYLDAHWGLLGPELTLHDASVSRTSEAGDSVVSAREVSIGVSVLTLFTERRLDVNRLTLVGTQLMVERTADGFLRLQRFSDDGEPGAAWGLEDTPEVIVIVRDSYVVYEDRIRGLSWEFQDVRLRLEREADSVVLEARASAPPALGSRIEVTAEGSLIGADSGQGRAWRLFAELRDVDFSALSGLLPDQSSLPQAGTGDMSFWLDVAAGRVVQGTAQLELTDLELPAPGSADTAAGVFERLNLTAEWRRIQAGWDVALSNLSVRRNGRVWSAVPSMELRIAQDHSGVSEFALRSEFLRFEDLTPFIALLPQTPASEIWLELAPYGDVDDLRLNVIRQSTAWDYSASAAFTELGFAAREQWPGVSRLSGELRADSRSGRLAITTEDALIDWPTMFRQPLEAEELRGILVWRQGRDGIRIVSDDFTLSNRDATTRSSLEMTIPVDGSSPRLELETDVFGFDIGASSRYLPAPRMPASIVRYLDGAIVGGRVTRARLTFFGPLDAFPFDGGEGQFHALVELEDGEMAFVHDWPHAQDLAGTIEFVNAGWVARGRGRVLRNESSDISVSIADMRAATLTVEANATGPLEDALTFLKESPLIARHLGPDLARLSAGAGTAEVALELSLPLLNRPAFEFQADLGVTDGEVAINGFAPSVTGIRGTLSLENGAATGDGIEAILLDGPVTARVRKAEAPGYRARVEFEGEVTADSVRRAFGLPMAAYVAGQTRWQGSLLLPAHAAPGRQRAPVRVNVDSNLSGVALRFPPPLAKAPGEPTSFELDFTFLEPERLDITGNLGASRRFALSLWNREEGLSFRRGSVRFGGTYPLMPPRDGLSVTGTLGQLRLDDWWEILTGALAEASSDGIALTADFDIADFSAFGQHLGDTELRARREGERWILDVLSEPIAGRLSIPADLGRRPQIVADMQRLRLSTASAAGAGDSDPRRLLGVLIRSEDFSLGQRRFGSFSANIQSDPLGLRLVSFQTQSDSFAVDGSGSWFEGAEGPTTRLALTLTSEDVAQTLAELALDPIAEADSAELTVSIYWPGGPSAQWRRAVSGDVAVRLEQGSVLDIDPGAGRMMGLMSITALPRRLALDFRDVFNRGLVFDLVDGDFLIIDGNAYTDNLKLTGPVADIGVAGRTGLRDQDYQQQAVVTAEPGKVLPTMGFFAGPGVGAALLIFTQIFKEPLKGIGRASYCMTGSWQEPSIVRLTPAELQEGRLCAELPPGSADLVQR